MAIETLPAQFRETALQIKNLSDPQLKKDLTWHDLAGYVDKTIMTGSLVREDIEPAQDTKDIEVRLDSYEDGLVKACTVALDEVDERFQPELRRAPALLKIFPILRVSTLFLNDPTNEGNFFDLRALNARLTDIATAFNVGEVHTDPQLNGPRAAMAAGFMHNADKYSKGLAPVTIEVTDQNLVVVRNPSRTPLPDNPFGLGCKGECGNTGYGLYIANFYALGEGITIQHSSLQVANELYDNQFAIPV